MRPRSLAPAHLLAAAVLLPAGPQIPANVWNLYNTQSACCNVNFLYSAMCLPNQTPEPTKFPTIKRVRQSFEVIPLKFFFQDMPDGDLPLTDLKEELINVLKRILIRFSETVPALVISSVEERVFLTRQLLLRRTDEEARRPTAAGLAALLCGHLSSWTRKLLRRPPRDLGQDIDLYFNVKVRSSAIATACLLCRPKLIRVCLHNRWCETRTARISGPWSLQKSGGAFKKLWTTYGEREEAFGHERCRLPVGGASSTLTPRAAAVARRFSAGPSPPRRVTGPRSTLEG